MDSDEIKTGESVRPDLPYAVVIGAGGMGTAIARRLGQRHRLLLADSDAGRAENISAALRADGYDALSIACDITDTQSVGALAERVAASGEMRVLAHVVGISPSMADWRTIIEVNLQGAARVSDALLPHSARGSAAVFISSLGAYLTPPQEEVCELLDQPLVPGFLERLDEMMGGNITPLFAYQLSKLGLNRMCVRSSLDWGRRGARIVSLSPGAIATPMGAREFSAAGVARSLKHELLSRSALQREGTMLEIADAVEFLTSDRASFITGTDLIIDGGTYAGRLYGADR